MNNRDLLKIIPYFASKFTQDQFKRMQIYLKPDSLHPLVADIDYFDVFLFKNIYPKHIHITSIN